MNRYEIALQVLEKLNPQIINNFEEIEEVPAKTKQTEYPLADAGLRIEEYIDSIMPLPEMTILLGKCEDGLPLLLDLEDPGSGAILISSRSMDQARYLLKAILTSARLINPSHQVQYSLISSQPNLFGNLPFQSHCHKNHHPNSREAGQYILDISALVEQRYSGRRRGPALLLCIDDLDAFERGSLDEEVFSHLQWIIKEGPSVKVWPIVIANLETQKSYNDHLMSQFGTKVFDLNQYPPINSLNYQRGNPLINHQSFEVSIGVEKLRFAVPIV